MKQSEHQANQGLAAHAAECARWVAVLGKPSQNLAAALAKREAGKLWRKAALVAVRSNLKFSMFN